MKKSLSLLLLCIQLQLNAQLVFQKTYGGSHNELTDCMYRGPGAVVQCDGNGYAILRNTSSYGVAQAGSGNSLYLLRIDDNGDTLFTKTYYSGGNCLGRSIHRAAAGGFIVGASMGGQQGGPALLRIDANGDTLWTRHFSTSAVSSGGTGFYGFPFSDGGFCAVGEYIQMIQSSSCGCAGLSKVDANGNLVFGKTYCWPYTANNYSTSLRFYSAAPTSDGGVIAAGYNTYLSCDVALVRTDSTGTVLWAKSYHLNNCSQSALHVQELPDHSIVVTGYVELSVTDWNSFLMKTDASGNILFANMYGDSLYQWTNSFVTNSNGDFILTGNYQDTSSPSTSQAYLLCLDSVGQIKWGKQYGGPGMELGNSLTTASDGGYAVVGTTNYFGSGNYDIYFVKTDSLGNAGCYTYPLSISVLPCPFITSNLNLQAGLPLYASAVPVTMDHGTNVTTVCTTAGIKENAAEELQLYPVPADEYLRFNPGTTGPVSARIISVSGRETASFAFTSGQAGSPLEIPVASLAEGVYFLQVFSEKGISVQRFVIVH